MSPHLTGKPHWPLTTYEKVWGFWHLAGITLTLGASLLLSPFPLILFAPSILQAIPMFTFLPIFGVGFIVLGVTGIFNWWQVIHGTIPDPHPFARPLAYLMNEPDPYKEQARMQAQLDATIKKEKPE